MRDNPTQRALALASAGRAFDGLTEVAAIRDAIQPLFQRRLASLAAIVAAMPCAERRSTNRRAQRAGRN